MVVTNLHVVYLLFLFFNFFIFGENVGGTGLDFLRYLKVFGCLALIDYLELNIMKNEYLFSLSTFSL